MVKGGFFPKICHFKQKVKILNSRYKLIWIQFCRTSKGFRMWNTKVAAFHEPNHVGISQENINKLFLVDSGIWRKKSIELFISHIANSAKTIFLPQTFQIISSNRIWWDKNFLCSSFYTWIEFCLNFEISQK